MRTIFFNTAWMKYYRGITIDDKPRNGGKYVKENDDCAEIYNFTPVDTDNGLYCFGYGETIRSKEKGSSQLRIENIAVSARNQDCMNDVLVVWCSTYEPKNYRVVGWYKNATVFRYHQNDDYGLYIAHANSSDCVLLPEHVRLENEEWAVPRAKNTGYGFGQANMWYPDKYPAAQEWLKKLVKCIDNYDGDNWIEWRYL